MPERKALPPWLAEIEQTLDAAAALLERTNLTPMQRLLELALAQHEALVALLEWARAQEGEKG